MGYNLILNQSDKAKDNLLNIVNTLYYSKQISSSNTSENEKMCVPSCQKEPIIHSEINIIGIKQQKARDENFDLTKIYLFGLIKENYNIWNNVNASNDCKRINAVKYTIQIQTAITTAR